MIDPMTEARRYLNSVFDNVDPPMVDVLAPSLAEFISNLLATAPQGEGGALEKSRTDTAHHVERPTSDGGYGSGVGKAGDSLGSLPPVTPTAQDGLPDPELRRAMEVLCRHVLGIHREVTRGFLEQEIYIAIILHPKEDTNQVSLASRIADALAAAGIIHLTGDSK